MLELKGKVAMVTGGSRGIGAAIVRKLAAHGAEVAFTFNSSTEKAFALVEEILDAGGNALAIEADSANKSDLEDAVEEVVSIYKKIDILINSAGIIVLGSIED